MNNTVTQEQITKIQESVDIVDVISSYLPLTSKGKNFFGVCPFHSDHSPSMSVSREKQIYKCFACGASGNVFNFVMNYENVTFYDALKMIANKAGIVLNINDRSVRENNKVQVLYDIFDITQKFYKNNINTKEGEKALEWIKNRRFDLSIVKDFELGLSLNQDDALVKLLTKKGYKVQDMLRTGLITKNERGSKDTYINRIMFPIEDLTGKLVGYSGRIYNGENSNKYFNTKETEIFKKGEILYNYNRAKESVKQKNQVIIVEGFFATIRLHTIGVDNVVATLGTAFTKNHANILKRMAKEIILCFDGDQAGNEATNSCIKELAKIGVTPKIVRLEDNLDPDDYVIKYGKDKMIEKLNNPMNIMDYKLNYHKSNKDLSNNQDLSVFINEMLEEIKKVDDDIYRELTLKKLSDISNLSIEVLRRKLDDKKVEKKEVPKSIKKVKLNRYEQAERNLVYYALNSNDIFKICIDKKDIFKNQDYIELLDSINKYIANNELKIASLLTYYRNDEKLFSLINELIDLELPDTINEEEIKDYINLLTSRKTKGKINNLKNNLGSVSSNNEKAKLVEQMLELRKKELEGANKYD